MRQKRLWTKTEGNERQITPQCLATLRALKSSCLSPFRYEEISDDEARQKPFLQQRTWQTCTSIMMILSSALAILRRQTQAERQGPCWALVCRMGREEQGQIAGALEELFLGLSHGFLSSRYYQHHCTEAMFDRLLSVIRDDLWDGCVGPRPRARVTHPGE